MGANDKKRAVSNTWPQIPETADIRDAWIRSETSDNPFDQRADIEAEFDCWLEQVKAEAKAEVLTEAADNLQNHPRLRKTQFAWGMYPEHMAAKEKTFNECADILRTRAEQIRGS